MCGDLNVNGPHGLIYLNAFSPTRRCDILGGNVSLGMDFEISKANAKFRIRPSPHPSCRSGCSSQQYLQHHVCDGNRLTV